MPILGRRRGTRAIGITATRARVAIREDTAKATTSEPTAGTTLTGETAPTGNTRPKPHPTTSKERRATIFKTARKFCKFPCVRVAAPRP